MDNDQENQANVSYEALKEPEIPGEPSTEIPVTPGAGPTLEEEQDAQAGVSDEAVGEKLKEFTLCPHPLLKRTFALAKWWTLAMTLLVVAEVSFGYVMTLTAFFDIYNDALSTFMGEASTTCPEAGSLGIPITQDTLDCFLTESRQTIREGGIPNSYRYPFASRDLYVSTVHSIQDLGRDAIHFNISRMSDYYALYTRLLALMPGLDLPGYSQIPRENVAATFGEILPGLFLLYVTGYLTLFLMMLCYGRFEQKAAATLHSLWQRGILHLVPGTSETSPGVNWQFVDFVKKYQAWMDHPLQLLACVLVAGLLLWRAWKTLGAIEKVMPVPSFALVLEYSQVLIGLVLGAFFYRLLVASIFFLRLGGKYELAPQVEHPDKAGGMSVLGNLFLWSALFFTLPAIYISFWSVIIGRFDPDSLQKFLDSMSLGSLDVEQFRLNIIYLFFLVASLVLVVASFFAFFLPMYGFHKEMERFRDRQQDKLDSLSKATGKLKEQLLKELETISAKDGAEKEQKIELQQKILLENQKIPTWPFDTQTILKFTAAQAGPILTLLGASDNVIEMIAGLFPA